MVSNPFGDPMTIVFQAETSALNSGINSVMNQLNSFEGAVGAAGAALAGLSAGGIAKSVSAAKDLDAALKESQAIMGDLTQNEMQGMEEAAREVGRTTTFSADQAGEAFYYLASAGMDAEQSMAAMGDVADFAQAGMFDLETATDLSTDALTSLGMAAEDPQENLENLNRVQDTFVRANELANASVEQYAQAMTNKLGPAMRSAGMEVEEGTAALSVFADAGLKGRRAGTILTRTIEGLQDGARENAEAFQELGIEVFNAEGEMRPMQSIVQDLEGALGDMSTEQRAAAMEQLGFNQRSRQGIEILMGQSDALGEYQSELENAGGATQRVAEKQLESFNNQIELLKSQFQDIAIEIGGVFLPYLTQIVKRLSVVVEWFSEFNSQTNGLAGAVALLSGLFGGLIMAGGALVSAMGGLSAALAPVVAGFSALGSAISILLGPIGLMIGIVATLGAMWASNFGGIRDQTIRVVSALRDALQPVFEAFGGSSTDILAQLSAAWTSFMSVAEPIFARIFKWIADNLIIAIQHLGEFLEWFVPIAVSGFNRFANVVQQAVSVIWGDYLQPFIAWFGPIAQDVLIATLGLAAKAWSGFQTAVSTAISVIWNDILLPFLEWFGPMWAQHMEEPVNEAGKTLEVWGIIARDVIQTVRENVGAFLEWLAPYWNAYWEEFAVEFQKFANEMRTIWDFFDQDVRATAEFLWAAVKGIFSGWFSIISSLLSAFAAALRADWDTMGDHLYDATVGTFTGIADFLVTWGERANARIAEIVRGIIDWFIYLGQRLIWGSLIPDILTAIRDAFVNYLTAVLDFVKQTFNNILSFITTQFTATKDFLATTLSNIYQFFSQQFTLLRNLVSDIWSALHSDTESVWGAISTFLSGTLSNIQQLFSRQFSAVRDFVSRTLSNIYRTVRDQMSSIQQFFDSTLGNVVSRVKTWASNAYSEFWDGLDRMYRALGRAGRQLKSRMGSIASDVVQKVKDVGSDMYNAGKNLIQSIVNGINDSPNAVKNAVASHVGKAAKFLPWSDAEEGPLSNLSESGPGLVRTIAQGIRAEGGRLSAAVREMAAGARAFLPRSDADTGPLSDLKAAGHSFGTTFAEGIRSSESEVTAAANSLSGAARDALGGDLPDNVVRSGGELRPTGELAETMDTVNELMMRDRSKVLNTESMMNYLEGFASDLGRDDFGSDTALYDFVKGAADWRMGGGAPALNPGIFGTGANGPMGGDDGPMGQRGQAPNIAQQFDSLAQSNRQAIQRLEGEMADRLDTLISHAKTSEGVVRIDGKKAGEVIESTMTRKQYSTEIHE